MNKNPTLQDPYPFIVGIDVSKESFDACMQSLESQKTYSITLGNTSQGFIKLKRWMKQHGNDDHGATLFCMEHTGIYTRNLVKYLLSRGGKVWLESSLQIKRSIGKVQRYKPKAVLAEGMANQ